MTIRRSCFVLVFYCLVSAGPVAAQTWQWRDITPSTGLRPEPRRYGSAIYDPVVRRVIVFGGLGNSGFLNDVWALNLETNSWARLETTGRSPDPRFGHNAVFDPAGYQMLVWAGQQGSRFFNDTHVLDLARLEWRDISPSRRPAARYGSASVFDPQNRHLIQFAGFTQESVRFQDTQAFDLQSLAWQDLTPPGIKPEVRCLHTAAFHAASRRMIIYGGQRSGPLDDLWHFDLQTRVWTRLNPPAGPPGRFFAASFVDRRGSFIVFGGSTSSGNSNETWSFNFETGQWTQFQIEGAPAPRSGMMGAYVESEDRFIVFGGSGAGLMNDVWQLSARASDSGRAFSVPVRGAVTWTAGTDSAATILGYARVQPGDPGARPGGVAFLSLRQNGVVVSETGIPASTPAMSGRIYAESEGPVQTAFGAANPNDRPANISFFFTDSSGQDFGHGTTQIAPNAQLAAFLNQAPFNGPSSFRGTLTFSSSERISVITLRTLTNERSEFLLTRLPVADLSTRAESAVFPLFANGGGWTSRIVMVNPTDETLSGSVRFGAGTLAPSLEGSGLPYLIPPRSSRTIERIDAGENTELSSLRIVPSLGQAAPAAAVILSLKSGGVTTTETGLSPGVRGSTFRLYAETSAGPDGPTQTAVAIVNYSSTPAVITVEPSLTDGSPIGSIGTLTIPALGQIAVFLNEVPGLETLAGPFKGLVRISADQSSSISVTGLKTRHNARRDFLVSETVAVEETVSFPAGEIVFPLLASGGGYSTQLVLFGGQGLAPLSGSLRIFSLSGQSLDLNLR